MTVPNERWTTLDLELYHDGQLDAQRVIELSADLRVDAELRARLARVRRVDQTVCASLLQPRDVASSAPMLSVRVAVRVACLLAFAVAIGWVIMRPTADPSVGERELARSPQPRSVRVVFSLPISSESQARVRQRSEQLAPIANDEDVFASRLDAALAGKQIDEASELLASAPPELRRAGYRRLAELLRSAEVAELILDQLTADEQLAACGEWAREPSVRPTVFARLRKLVEDPKLAGKVQGLFAELSADPAMRTWLKGYQLLHNS